MVGKWIVTIHQAEKPKFRVFAFCNGGAGPTIYFPWKPFIPDDVEFHALQLPGRELRCDEGLIREMKPLINEICDSLMQYQDLPFAFFGHSIGALIAFETARELRRRNAALPAALFLAAYTPPEQIVRPPIYQLPQEEFISAIGQYYEPIPPEYLKHKKFIDLYLAVLRADTQVADTYKHEDAPPLDIPIWVFGGDADPLAHEASLKGWSKHTTLPLKVKMYPGGHFFINKVRDQVCALMMDALAKI